MSKPWGSIGDWAADVEREEQEQAAAVTAAASSGNFPSLRESIATKPRKMKMTLTEFHNSGGLSSDSKGLTPDEMFRLPTGPKERSPEEMQHRLGGGFSNYGRTGLAGQGRMREQHDGTDGNWGANSNSNNNRRQYGGFEGERRGPSARVSDYDQTSRADEVDNWSISKQPSSVTTQFNSSNRQNRFTIGGGGGLCSRADEVDDWTRGKKSSITITSTGNSHTNSNYRSSSFGSGFRDSGGPEADRWTRAVPEPERERRRLVLNPPESDIGGSDGGSEIIVKTNKSNPFGAARPREEVLAEKGLDWKRLDMEIEAKKTASISGRPPSAHSSRPSSAHSARSDGQGVLQQQGLDNVAVKPRPKANPFGDAKPREVLLQERGQDWRKIDLELEHRGVDRPETDEEKLLKEEIKHLKKEVQTEESLQGPGGNQSIFQDRISQKEKELEQMIRDFDDKVRFGQKAVDRPGSGARSAASFSERPPSQSGSFDDSRSIEYMDRPRSGSIQNVWTRPGDERRVFRGGRERGFLGSRDFDRSRSRERW